VRWLNSSRGKTIEGPVFGLKICSRVCRLYSFLGSLFPRNTKRKKSKSSSSTHTCLRILRFSSFSNILSQETAVSTSHPLASRRRLLAWVNEVTACITPAGTKLYPALRVITYPYIAEFFKQVGGYRRAGTPLVLHQHKI
jgi:hypothetical protein